MAHEKVGWVTVERRPVIGADLFRIRVRPLRRVARRRTVFAYLKIKAILSRALFTFGDS